MPHPIYSSRVVPEHAHPFVRLVFSEMRDQRLTGEFVGREAGLSHATIATWKNRGPNLTSIEAVLNVLGYDLVVKKRHHA